MNKVLLILLVSLMAFSSCKKKGTSTSTLPENVLENDFQFNYFSTKAKVDYLDAEQNLSTPVIIKIKQDSAIWMSITPALGIEMMRVLIRKDSVFMINKIKKEYFAGSFDYLRNYFGMGVNYKLVEKMLVGNIPLKNSSNQKSTKTETHFILEQLFSDFVITNKVARDNRRMSNLSIEGTKSDFVTNLKYSDFELIDEVSFAKQISLIKTEAGKKTTVDVKYSKPKVSDDPISLSFSIPSNYEPIKMQ